MFDHEQKNGPAMNRAKGQDYDTGGKRFRLFAEVIAASPGKTLAELCHTLELQHHTSMAIPSVDLGAARAQSGPSQRHGRRA